MPFDVVSIAAEAVSSTAPLTRVKVDKPRPLRPRSEDKVLSGKWCVIKTAPRRRQSLRLAALNDVAVSFQIGKASVFFPGCGD